MALALLKDTDAGVPVRYHRILRYSVDLLPQAANPGVTGPLVTVTVGEYASQELREDGRMPVRHEACTFVMDPQDLAVDLRIALYNALAAGRYAGSDAA